MSCEPGLSSVLHVYAQIGVHPGPPPYNMRRCKRPHESLCLFAFTFTLYGHVLSRRAGDDKDGSGRGSNDDDDL